MARWSPLAIGLTAHGAAFAALVALKIGAVEPVAGWSWVWVCSPIWSLPAAAALGIAVFVAYVALVFCAAIALIR